MSSSLHALINRLVPGVYVNNPSTFVNGQVNRKQGTS